MCKINVQLAEYKKTAGLKHVIQAQHPKFLLQFAAQALVVSFLYNYTINALTNVAEYQV